MQRYPPGRVNDCDVACWRLIIGVASALSQDSSNSRRLDAAAGARVSHKYVSRAEDALIALAMPELRIGAARAQAVAVNTPLSEEALL
jgi:hypothetical protein